MKLRSRANKYFTDFKSTFKLPTILKCTIYVNIVILGIKSILMSHKVSFLLLKYIQ